MYHLFRKTVQGKNGKEVRRWYYWFYDTDGKRKNRVCPNCTNRSDAEAYIKSLAPPLITKGDLIKDITASMFLSGSDHVLRKQELGAKFSIDGLKDYRRYILFIQELWGEIPITDLTVKTIISSLLSIDKSSSWKNRVISVLKEVYAEAAWQGISVSFPSIPRFAKNYHKADILTSEEIQRFFVADNFPSHNVFLLFFLCLMCGLRLGEARALQYAQVNFEKKCLIVNGFLRRNGQKVPFLKKGSEDDPKWRVVILPDVAINHLRWYFQGNYYPDDFIFTKEGKPYRNEYLEACFKRALKKAGIDSEQKRLIPHSLRYTYVTRMRRYAPIELVQKLAGHTSEGMTEYYTRFSLEDSALAVAPALEAANKLLDEM